MSAVLRRLVAALAIVTSGLVAVASPPAAAGTVAPDAETAVRDIVFPIAGAGTYTDTFGACRSGCSRGHEGTDIMAPKLSKAVAATDARVVRLKAAATPDGSQGNYLMLEDADGWEYWYVHVNNDSPGTDDGANPPEWIFAPGIELGSEVVAGEHVAYVGDSGNAERSGSHLHFEIHKPDGSVINPYRSLNEATRLDEPVDAGSSIADSPQGRFVQALHHDFLGRAATGAEIRSGVDRLARGTHRAAIVEDFATSDEWIAGLLGRYYRDTLGRAPDAGGLEYWSEVLRTGTPAADVAAYFYASDEYYRRSGSTDRGWVTDLYRALLQRNPDDAGLDHWTAVLSRGVPRSTVALDFYQSLESRRTRVAGLYRSLLGRSPDAGGHTYWADVITDGHDIRLATFLASSDEYYRRAGRRTFR